MADLLTASDESAALEDLHTRGMVLASGLEADMVLGTMGPGHGIATIEKVAVAAVMAGCLSDYMPVVLAAVKAVIDPAFDLTEMQATTHCTAPLIIVNGPARHTCGPISSSYGALGPGHRANASIGRALRLTMINIGGGRPGTSDMALLGHPGKFTFCLAEDEENSPFPPMHVDLGFDPDDSVVTVIGAEAPHSVLYSGDGDDPNGYKSLLAMLAIGIANAATNNAILTGGSATIVLNPEHADVLIKAGLTRQDIAEEIHQRSTIAETAINKLAPGFARKDSGNRDAFKGPEQLLILMSGGSGLYSMVMPSWCAGPHKNSASSIKVESEFFCEVPGLANLVI